MSFEGILSDIKVLDFSTLLPGPLASLFLSEMGAEVIKVERLKFGDEMRRKTLKIDVTNVSFAILSCCTVVKSLKEAVGDGHFVLRNLFSKKVKINDE